MTQAYNSHLLATLTQLETSLGVTIHRLDLAGPFADVLAHPAKYGFTNVTTGAVGDGNHTGEGYLFWDDFYPTTAGHALIASQASALIVPEPSSLALLGTAGVSMLLWRRCRRTRPRTEGAVCSRGS
jgi:phospholipase/lecithinase/hemolysin